MRNATSSLLSTVLVLGSSALACGGSPASGHSSADEEEAIGVSRAALTTLVVEAESATGAGVIESDPNASNGQVRAFSNVYDAATASFTTNGTVQSGTVRVRTAQCAPQWAQVLVDGVIVLTEMLSTTDAWIDLPLDVAGIPAGNHTVTFKYRMGTNGCAFRYDHATFEVADPVPPPQPTPPMVLEAENATGAGVIQADRTASNGQRRAFSTMYETAQATLQNTTTATSVTVRAYGSSCSSVPKLALFVDGQSVMTKDVPQTTWTDYSANVAIPPGSHTVTLQYRWSGGTGCQLRIDKTTFAFD